jgi:hypothetical protein
MDEQFDEVLVYLRDLTADSWTHFPAGDWIDRYAEQINAVLDIHSATLGGTLSLTGTPERGRVTVYAAVTQNVVVDFDWHTMTIAEARGQAGAAA